MKTTLNPFENAKRTAQGTGGVSPSVIEEIQAEISVLGSQNETQAQDITDIKAQLEELAGAYSTTEHKTGRKWIDGRDIWEKTIVFSEPVNITTSYTVIETDTDVGVPLLAYAVDPTYKASMTLKAGVENARLMVIAFDEQFTAETVTIEFVKSLEV